MPQGSTASPRLLKAALFTATTTVAALATLLGACSSGSSNPYVGETVTVGDVFQSGIFGPDGGGVHLPYVTGATVTLVVGPSSGQDLTGWTMYSTAPEVMRVDSQIELLTHTAVTRFDGGTTRSTEAVSTLAAVAPGTAVLAVRNPAGASTLSTTVTVATPDELRLYAAGDYLAGAADPEVTSANIVVGGKATFLVRYFAGGKELYGTGALQASAPSGFTVTTPPPSATLANDFLFVTPTVAGASGSVSLSVGGAAIGALAVTAVPAEAVSQIDLVENAATTSSGLGLLYARTKNDASVEIYGASLDWSVAGQTLDTTTLDPSGDPADLFFYPATGGAPHTLVATYGGHTVSAAVNEDTQYVGSTAYSPKLSIPYGCSASSSPGSRAPLPPVLVLGVALTLALVARRRRADGL